MPSSVTAPQVLEREFLGMRSRLIELGAAMDRIQRATGFVSGDPRMEKMRRAAELLAGESTDKAEQIQLLFSLPYEEGWRDR